MSKDKELKCKLNSKMLILNGHANSKSSSLIWKAKVKKLRVTYSKWMICFSKWLQLLINKKIYCSRDKAYCMKILNKQRNKSLQTIFMVRFRTVIKWLKIQRNRLKKYKCKLKKLMELFFKDNKLLMTKSHN